MKQLNIIFLALMFSDESLKEAYSESKCGVQIATHLFQKNLYEGLIQHNGVDVEVINVPPIGSFPINYRKMIIKSKKWNNNSELGYFNIPYIKHIQQKKNVEREILKKIKKECENVIITYSLYLPFLEAAVSIKNNNPNIKICLIQTDCVDGRNGMQKYNSKRAKARGDKQVQLARNVDCFVVLTKHLCEPLEINGRPFKVLECICDETQALNHNNSGSKNICLYTGTLDTCYGIKELVKAFTSIDNGILWICGDGDAKDYVVEASQKHQNIIYFGFVNHNQMLDLRNQCDYLINPRRPDGTYTLYSFPSKTTEYMLSGKPTIMYKLEGIPDEYDDYLIYLTSDEPQSIAEELKIIFSNDYNLYLKIANDGRNFMIKNKNRFIQAGKIIELINDISTL